MSEGAARDLDVIAFSGIFPNRVQPAWGVHVFQNVRALSQHAAVRAVAPVPFIPLVPPALAPGRYRDFRGIARADTFASIPVLYPRYPVLPRLGRPLNAASVYLGALRCVAALVRARRPDALIAYFAYPYGVAGVMLGRRLGLPVIVSCRGTDINAMTGPRAQGRLIGSALRSAAAVLVVSRDMQERVLALGVARERVRCIPNGVDTVRFAPRSRGEARKTLGLDADARLLVCVSRLSPEKGIDVLVEACRTLDRVQVVVVGEGLERAALETRLRAHGMESRFRLAGARPHDEIPAWIAAADVVALPSRSEGMPNAVLEALASGRPVVASHVGGVPELLSDPSLGTTVPPDDPPALARALSEALSRAWDDATIARSVAGRSWDAVGMEVAEVVRSVRTDGALNRKRSA